MLNDAKTFTSELGGYTDTVTFLLSSRKTAVVMFEQTDEDSTFTELQVIFRGRKLLIGTQVLDDGVDQITFSRPNPKKSIVFQLKPGKAHKYNRPAKVLFDGVKVGKAKDYGRVTFLGFEEVTTPLGTFADAAHFERTANLLIKSGHDRLEFKS